MSIDDRTSPKQIFINTAKLHRQAVPVAVPKNTVPHPSAESEKDKAHDRLNPARFSQTSEDLKPYLLGRHATSSCSAKSTTPWNPIAQILPGA